MKGLLLTATVMMAASMPAYAGSEVKLPIAMIGSWCLDENAKKAADSSNNVEVYNRSDPVKVRNCSFGMNVVQNSYATNEYFCVIRQKKRISDNIYSLHVKCGESPENEWTADEVFEIHEHKLYVRGKAVE